MNKPQKYVRYSGLRPEDFEPQVSDDGLPSGLAATLCVIVAAVIAILISMA